MQHKPKVLFADIELLADGAPVLLFEKQLCEHITIACLENLKRAANETPTLFCKELALGVPAGIDRIRQIRR